MTAMTKWHTFLAHIIYLKSNKFAKILTIHVEEPGVVIESANFFLAVRRQC